MKDPASRYENEALLARGISIRFNGVGRTNVEAYCVPEGWIRTALGKTLERPGKPLTITHRRTVEPYLEG